MKDKSYENLNFLWMVLHQARDAIFKLREKELHRFGISTPQAEILFNIEAIGYQPTPTEISKRLLREFHSVSSILIRMEKKGLVKKESDLNRSNLVRISLTDKGRKIYDEAAKRETIFKILSCLSETETIQLLSSLKKIRDEAVKALGMEDRLELLGY